MKKYYLITAIVLVLAIGYLFFIRNGTVMNTVDDLNLSEGNQTINIDEENKALNLNNNSIENVPKREIIIDDKEIYNYIITTDLPENIKLRNTETIKNFRALLRNENNTKYTVDYIYEKDTIITVNIVNYSYQINNEEFISTINPALEIKIFNENKIMSQKIPQENESYREVIFWHSGSLVNSIIIENQDMFNNEELTELVEKYLEKYPSKVE